MGIIHVDSRLKWRHYYVTRNTRDFLQIAAGEIGYHTWPIDIFRNTQRTSF